MTIGERIKHRREELGLSQDEVAIRCGYKSRSSINKIENTRNLPIDKVEVIARVLDVSPEYIMGWCTDISLPSTNNMTIGERIRYRREELELSQEELGILAGYRGSVKSRISRYESAGNDISLKQLSKIASALNVSEAYLMGWEGSTLTDVNLTPNEQLMIDRYREIPEEKKSEILGHFLSYTESILKAER